MVGKTGIEDGYTYDEKTNRFTFENKSSRRKIRYREFLSNLPVFSQFTDRQLNLLENSASSRLYHEGDMICRQGDVGDYFYIVKTGRVEIFVQDDSTAQLRSPNRRLSSYGKLVSVLKKGDSFGERALMTKEKRAASARCVIDSELLLISRSVYQELLCHSSALIDEDLEGEEEYWGLDEDSVAHLYRHVDQICNFQKATKNSRRILYEMSTAFTPELTLDEVISRMVRITRSFLHADRVGLFLLNDGGRTMTLKVSERAKGIRLPLRGLAGDVILNNEVINIADAYVDPRFDSTMDRRTGYRTKQVLGVPLRHVNGLPIGVLQINNRTDGIDDRFDNTQEQTLMIAGEQLVELIKGRMGELNRQGSEHQHSSRASLSGNQGMFYAAANSDERVLESAKLKSYFTVRLNSFAVPSKLLNKKEERKKIVSVEVVTSLHFALQLLCPAIVVDVSLNNFHALLVGGNYHFNTNVTNKLNILCSDIPRAARIKFQTNAVLSDGRRIPLGWAATPVWDFRGYLEWNLELRCFEGGINAPIQTTLNNRDVKAPFGRVSAILAPDLMGFWDPEDANSFTPGPKTHVLHTMPVKDAAIQGAVEDFTQEKLDNLKRIELLSFAPMSEQLLTDNDREFIWSLRYCILDRPELLPCFIMSVQWNDHFCVAELYDLLELWEPPKCYQALQLLDRKFMDPKVRSFAVHSLQTLDDNQLALYMLQLCQQLKFENYADSALSRFLVRRAVGNPRLIGHIFYWSLRSEIYNHDIKGRFHVLLDVYLKNCDLHRLELGQQMFVMKLLENVAFKVAAGESREMRKEILTKSLNSVVLPIEFQLPLNPNYRVSGIRVDKCRVMESKKKPLWLTMTNADKTKPDIIFMLKVGDDLRQDSLILQLLKVMDDIWHKEGLDMHMNVYDCISTGYERGLLQVVSNATTLGSMVLDATDHDRRNSKSKSKYMRKFKSAMKAFGNFDIIKDWMWEQVCSDATRTGNDVGLEEQMDERVMNFIFSTAAYCVASYVLGLGDRHNDNLMMTRSGHFFHIDFGHILGNFKYKLGIKRERAPFVFTPSMKAVMSDSQYDSFVELCCDIYNVLRENSSLLIALVSLAIPCELPELREEKDVQWMYDKLLVGRSEEEAAAHFREILEKSLNTVGTRVNDAAHMIAHA